MAYYAGVNNGTVVHIIESDVAQPGCMECSADVQTGWQYSNGVFSPAPEPPKQPEVVIIGLSYGGQQLALADRVILSAGQSLGVSVRIEVEGRVLPVTDRFAVPICRVRGDVDQTVNVQFYGGVAEFSVQFPRSGEYAVLPEWLNMHLPADKRLGFQPFYISVTN